jgi:DNA-binding NtrC family response regulator
MPQPPHILIADDERSIRLMLETGLTLNGFRVTAVRTGREALEAAGTGGFDAVLSDIYMPELGGLDLVEALRSADPHTPIVLMTAQGSLEAAVEAVSRGASDFIGKPFEIAAVVALLRRYIDARREAQSAVEPPEGLLTRNGLVGRSAPLVMVYKLVAQAARSDATVLILGESGTGKELVARAIHDFSARSARPFLSVNCSGLTDTLLESELFGYVRGAFTGATGERPGLFEAADGGTLFLDELASTTAAFQASLLRVLQSGEVRRVGSTQSRRVNVRVIGASNAPLRDLAAAGSFRSDLYYRLSVLSIELPPLRARSGDVEMLTAHFLRQFRGPGDPPYHLTTEAMAALAAHDFPGNVRELENALRRATALSSGGLITIDCLPPEIAAARPSPGGPASEQRLIADRPSMDELQRRYLQLILEETGWNRRRAAAVLELDRRTIQRLIARYQLNGAVDPEGESDGEGEDG